MSEPVVVQEIASLSLLEGVPAEARENIARIFLAVSEEVDFEDGETLMQEDYMAFEAGYILARGTVQVERGGKVVSELNAPALLGEMSQFKAGDTRTATVRAKEAAVALQFQWDEFHAEVKKTLSPSDRKILRDALERLVWDRFGHGDLVDLPLWRGLPEEIRRKICSVFPWIVESESYKDGDIVFTEGDRCQSKGYLLVKGGIQLRKGSMPGKVFQAPHLLGVMPKNEPDLTWSATGTAQGDVSILSFSWRAYTAQLEEHLTDDELSSVVEAMRRNAAEHFWR